MQLPTFGLWTWADIPQGSHFVWADWRLFLCCHNECGRKELLITNTFQWCSSGASIITILYTIQIILFTPFIGFLVTVNMICLCTGIYNEYIKSFKKHLNLNCQQFDINGAILLIFCTICFKQPAAASKIKLLKSARTHTVHHIWEYRVTQPHLPDLFVMFSMQSIQKELSPPHSAEATVLWGRRKSKN